MLPPLRWGACTHLNRRRGAPPRASTAVPRSRSNRRAWSACRTAGDGGRTPKVVVDHQGSRPSYQVSLTRNMSTLDDHRARLSPEQQMALNAIWRYYVEHGKWIPHRVLHAQCGGKAAVRQALQTLGGSIAFESRDQGSGVYQFTLLGALLTDAGPEAQRLLLRYLKWVRQMALRDPLMNHVESGAVQAALNLSTEETQTLGRLILLGNFWGGSASHGASEWKMAVPHDVEDIPEDVETYLEQKILKDYDAQMPFEEGPRRTYQWDARPSTTRQEVSRLAGRRIVTKAMDPEQGRDRNEWDVFISHASEDKAEVAEPLVQVLVHRDVRVWYDRIVLEVGDSLRRRIDEGLAKSRFGIVVLSPAFFGKGWPERELAGLVQKEIDGQKVILPIWHKVTAEEVRRYSPILADRVAGSTAEGIEPLADRLVRAMRGDVQSTEHRPQGLVRPNVASVAATSRTGLVSLDGVEFETDARHYSGPEIERQHSMHRGIGGSLTLQDFGSAVSPEPLRLRTGQAVLNKATMLEVQRRYLAGGSYCVTDWLGNEFTAFIGSFRPRATGLDAFAYEMELKVTKVAKLYGEPYTGRRS